MLERLRSTYDAPGNLNDNPDTRFNEGVPISMLPPGCLTNADRWDYTFSSAPEMERWLERCLDRDPAGQLYSPVFHPDSRPSHDWSWGWTRGEILELSRRGWHQVAAEVGPLALDVSNSELGTTHEPGLENDVEGTDVDVEAFLRGEPESMRAFREIRTSGQTVTLVIDGYISWAEKGDVHFRRGAAIAAAVLALQAQNIAVSVLLRWDGDTSSRRDKKSDGADCKNGDRRLILQCWLHRPGDVLDISRLLVWLAHPGWIRGIFYGVHGLLVGGRNGWHGSGPQVSEGVIAVPPSDSSVFASFESAEAFIRQAAEAAI